MKHFVSRWALLCAPVLACMVAAQPMSATTFTYTGGFQSYTATIAGVYQIVAYGAQGGGSSPSGGLGAEIGGNFTLSAGEMLSVAVGGGGQLNPYGGAGGGGTFVVGPGANPLVIAGGGGGSGFNTGPGSNASTGTSGISAGGAGGTSGSGGGGSTGSGGAGFYGAGGQGTFGPGGSDYAQGLAGGSGYGATGGFGGGGGSGEGAGGGGGGFSGGGGGSTSGGGGGGSYVAASATYQILLAGVVSPDGSTNGYVSIMAPAVTPPVAVTPEPSGVLLLGTGLLSLGGVFRRRFAKALGVKVSNVQG